MNHVVDDNEDDLSWENHKQLLAQLLAHAYQQHKQRAKGGWRSFADLMSLKENGGLQLSVDILMQYRQGRQSVSLQRAHSVADAVTRAGIHSPEIDISAQKIQALSCSHENGEALTALIANRNKSLEELSEKLIKFFELWHEIVSELVDLGPVESDPLCSDPLIQSILNIAQEIVKTHPEAEPHFSPPES
jgi:hypothetical protein